MTLDALATKLQKEHFRIAVIQGLERHFEEIAATLRFEGYAVSELPRPYLPASFFESVFTRSEARMRRVLLAQALAPYAQSVLRELPDAVVVNYSSPSDEGEALAAVFMTLFPRYTKNCTLVLPFVYADEAAILSSVRIAHGVSFYCTDLARFLDALASVYPEQQTEPRSLFSDSVRILTDASFPQEQKYHLLRPLLESFSSLLEKPELAPRFAPASEQIVSQLRFRIHGLYSLLYEKPLQVLGMDYA